VILQSSPFSLSHASVSADQLATSTVAVFSSSRTTAFPFLGTVSIGWRMLKTLLVLDEANLFHYADP
jgi:hypothetical protein